jgi:hypothetical protein
MSYVIDNDSANAVSLGDAWTPKLNGEIFCAPACGFGCKKLDFDRVTERATALAKKLGDGWRPRVWENGGWHFEVTKGAATVCLAAGGEYRASVRFSFNDAHQNCVSESRIDPREAVEALIAQMNRRVATLSRALVSVSLSPLEIENV